MPVYLGFSVSMKEAFRLFGLDYEKANSELKERHSKKFPEYPVSSYELSLDVESFLREKGANIDIVDVGPRLYVWDEDLCIIGYKVHFVSDCGYKFLTSRDFRLKLEAYEASFWDTVNKIGCIENFDKITVKHQNGALEEIEPRKESQKDNLYIIEIENDD